MVPTLSILESSNLRETSTRKPLVSSVIQLRGSISSHPSLDFPTNAAANDGTSLPFAGGGHCVLIEFVVGYVGDFGVHGQDGHRVLASLCA